MGDKVEALYSGDGILGVVGLGYVGLPLAVSFARKVKVVGFDISEDKVELLLGGVDPTGELGSNEMAEADIHYTADPAGLKDASFIVVAVPTPIDAHQKPDLGPLLSASQLIGENISPGATVIYESTVYPGATEDDCVPVIERASGLKCGVDFKVGYSPERINPGDTEHTFERIIKIVSGMDDDTLDEVARLYEGVVTAGVHRAPTIRTAEAAKVIENTQRDINIALMNELSLIFDRAGIETRDVLAAAGTKWNFLKFHPGLVGGHCIGVDPYYLTHKAEELGYKSQVILAGRAVNDNMGKHVAENVVKGLIRSGRAVLGSRVLVLGVTFKENVSDLRNSKVKNVIEELREYGIDVLAHDPEADPEEAKAELEVDLVEKLASVEGSIDGIVFAVGHRAYDGLDLDSLAKLAGKNGCVLADVKMRYSAKDAKTKGFSYWSL